MLYSADLAAINFYINSHGNSLEMNCSGYNDSLQPFLMKLFQKISIFDPREFKEHYQNIHQKEILNIRNFYKNSPVQQAFSFYNWAIKFGGENFHPDESLEILNSIDFEDIERFHVEWLRTTRTEW